MHKSPQIKKVQHYIKLSIKLAFVFPHLPALCAGFIPIPSLVIIALVADGTLN